MDSQSLEPWQAEKLNEAVRPSMAFLHRLRERMQKVGFLPGDKLYQLVCKAHDALHTLTVELHYLSCASGVGRESKKA